MRYNILEKIDYFVPIVGFDIAQIKTSEGFVPVTDYGFVPEKSQSLLDTIASLGFTFKF